jgi:flagellar P-ring protein precursor FlgI
VETEPDVRARVIIAERTGTIVVGAHVTLSPVAIAHGGLRVEINEQPGVSQPEPLSSGGRTQTVPQTDIRVQEGSGRLHAIAGAATVQDVAAALNALGVAPRDLVAIFQALHAAGALRAEIRIL